MKDYSAETLAALSARTIVARDFLWLKVRRLDNGLPFEYGFWSDVGDVQASVIDPETGATVTRGFEGAGSLISIGDIPQVSNLTVQTVSIRLSQIDEAVNAVVRGYDLRQGGVEIYRLLFSPETRQPVAAELPRFVGFIDRVEIVTPAEGEEGSIALSCVSHTQEMTRSNPDTRSDASQKLRDATDDFFIDTTVAAEWELFWGMEQDSLG